MIKRHFVDVLAQRLKKDITLIQVILGPRQVGKTTGIKQLIELWKGTSLFVSADEVATPNSEWVEFQWDRALSRGKGTLLVIDEIQKIPDWSRIIKVLFDRDRGSHALKIVLLGSASLKIQKGLTESLVGRYEKIYVPHWTFNECQDCFGWSLREYILYGGYPGSAHLVSDFKRWKKFIHDSIIEPVITRDLLEISSVYKPALFRQCFELVMSLPAQEVSLQKLLGQLQESGNASTIKHYLELFEGAFLLKVLHKYSGSLIKKRVSSPKIIPLNTALPQGERPQSKGLGDDEPDWYGRLFESVVGSKLLEFDGDLYYWRDGKYEVDFVLKSSQFLFAIEVKSARRSHLKGLQKFKLLHPEAVTIIIDNRNIEDFLSLTDSEKLVYL